MPPKMENRRFRRANLVATAELWDVLHTDQRVSGTATNVSLTGASINLKTDKPDIFKLDQHVGVSIGIPVSERKDFPFARLAGNARVVHVESDASAHQSCVGLAFAGDITYLTSIPE